MFSWLYIELITIKMFKNYIYISQCINLTGTDFPHQINAQWMIHFCKAERLVKEVRIVATCAEPGKIIFNAIRKHVEQEMISLSVSITPPWLLLQLLPYLSLGDKWWPGSISQYTFSPSCFCHGVYHRNRKPPVTFGDNPFLSSVHTGNSTRGKQFSLTWKHLLTVPLWTAGSARYFHKARIASQRAKALEKVSSNNNALLGTLPESIIVNHHSLCPLLEARAEVHTTLVWLCRCSFWSMRKNGWGNNDEWRVSLCKWALQWHLQRQQH